MSVIVTYDVSAQWWKVKIQAFELGFFNIIKTTVGDRVLPNTTLFIDNVSPEEAVRLFDLAVQKARTDSGQPIIVEKLLVGTTTDWLS